jgi:hypothetical protein
VWLWLLLLWSPHVDIYFEQRLYTRWAEGGTVRALFVWLISHQPAVLFSQNKSATSQQYISLRTNQHQPSATSRPNRLRTFRRASDVTYVALSFFLMKVDLLFKKQTEKEE